MAGIETLNSSSPFQHIQFIIADRMTVLTPFRGEEIAAEDILNEVFSPINNRPSILEYIYPLAIDWYSALHIEPRFSTIIPQNSDSEGRSVIKL